jgi:Na+/H+-translocating membrane pyrophosphatase
MATKPLKTVGRFILLAAPVVIVVVVMILLKPWLKQQGDTLPLVVSAIAAIFVMAYSYYFASRHERSMDEVMLASQRFAYARGTEAGWFVVPLIMMLPPVTNKLVDLAITMSSGPNDSIERSTVQIGIAIGFMLVVIMQGLGMAIAGIVWWRRSVSSS